MEEATAIKGSGAIVVSSGPRAAAASPELMSGNGELPLVHP